MMNNDDLQERIKKLKVVQHRIGQTEEEQAQMCKLLNDVAEKENKANDYSQSKEFVKFIDRTLVRGIQEEISNPESHLMGGEKNHGQ